LEAVVTGKTVATPGLFATKPKFFAGNTVNTPSVFKTNALQTNPRPYKNLSTKNRSMVMMSNALVDQTDATVLPEQDKEQDTKNE
jgi:hypothetical protein